MFVIGRAKKKDINYDVINTKSKLLCKQISIAEHRVSIYLGEEDIKSIRVFNKK